MRQRKPHMDTLSNWIVFSSVLLLCAECCRAPASCRRWYVTESSRQLWGSRSPEWLPPPTRPPVPPCRCLRCQTAVGKAVCFYPLVSCLATRIHGCFSVSLLSFYQLTHCSASRVSWCLCRGPRSCGRTF